MLAVQGGLNTTIPQSSVFKKYKKVQSKSSILASHFWTSISGGPLNVGGPGGPRRKSGTGGIRL